MQLEVEVFCCLIFTTSVGFTDSFIQSLLVITEIPVLALTILIVMIILRTFNLSFWRWRRILTCLVPGWSEGPMGRMNRDGPARNTLDDLAQQFQHVLEWQIDDLLLVLEWYLASQELEFGQVLVMAPHAWNLVVPNWPQGVAQWVA
jgi:hypothetical protein